MSIQRWPSGRLQGYTDPMLEPKGPNAAQIQFWNETAGQKWVNYQETINAHARPFGLLAMDRASILSGERVLDLGCGCGDTTFELTLLI